MKGSIAFLPARIKHVMYEEFCSQDFQSENIDYSVYFAVARGTGGKINSTRLDTRVEDDLELLSDLSTWGERYRYHFPEEEGVYVCSRCSRSLYPATSKWAGPCVWPSFRQEVANSLSFVRIDGYNSYTCAVDELYCSECDLFIGHRFDDGPLKGDSHPDARWRH